VVDILAGSDRRNPRRNGKANAVAVPQALLAVASILADIAREAVSEDRAAATPTAIDEEANIEGNRNELRRVL
jgi:hypothetical protein